MSGRYVSMVSLAVALAAAPLCFCLAADAPPKTESEWKAYFKELDRGRDASSYFLLGTYYAAGHPQLSRGKPDASKAFSYYEKAAELGHPEAQYRLGYCYEHKIGVRRANMDLAFSWYLKAADQEVPAAQLRVGELYFDNKGAYYNAQKAFFYLSKAAERGLPDAQRMVGDCHKIGWGTERSNVQALAWYIIAARQENEKAINNRDTLKAFMKKPEIEAAEKSAKGFRVKP